MHPGFSAKILMSIDVPKYFILAEGLVLVYLFMLGKQIKHTAHFSVSARGWTVKQVTPQSCEFVCLFVCLVKK